MSSNLVTGAKKDLLDLIKRGGSCSVDEATEKLHLAKTTIRQHLISLEQQGLIEREFRKTGPGRPQLTYALSSAGQRLYPAHEPQLLRSLIEHLAREGHEDLVRDFFEKFWNQRRQNFTALLKDSSEKGPQKSALKARMDALRTLLEAEGFMPEFSPASGKSVSVRECNCPFSEAIQATRIPCKLESEFIRWALGTPMERTSYIPAGDSACTYSAPKKTRKS